jgi:hypothetical protein
MLMNMDPNASFNKEMCLLKHCGVPGKKVRIFSYGASKCLRVRLVESVADLKLQISSLYNPLTSRVFA